MARTAQTAHFLSAVSRSTFTTQRNVIEVFRIPTHPTRPAAAECEPFTEPRRRSLPWKCPNLRANAEAPVSIKGVPREAPTETPSRLSSRR